MFIRPAAAAVAAPLAVVPAAAAAFEVTRTAAASRVQFELVGARAEGLSDAQVRAGLTLGLDGLPPERATSLAGDADILSADAEESAGLWP